MTTYNPITGTGTSGFSYIGADDFGTEVESFISGSDSIRGGFYQEPSQPYRSLLEEKMDPRYAVIVNRERGMDRFISNLSNRGIPIRELDTPYHAKAFIDTSSERGLVLTGNISRSAIRNSRIESREQTLVTNPFERAAFAVSNLLNLGYEGTKYQVNMGFSLDRSRTRELHSILDEVEDRGSARSTDNFIVGGPLGNSSAIISNHIRARTGQEISVMAPYIDDPQVTSALLDAIKGGSKVRIITTNPNAVGETIRGTFLSEPNIIKLMAASADNVEVYTPSSNQNLLVHAKAIGFEDGSGIIGSHNFTSKAGSRQVEISVFYEDAGIAEQYSQDFERMIGITERMKLPREYQHLVDIKRAEQDNLISSQMSAALEGGVILPTNLGGSYFYARAMYNFTMREAGHHDFIVSNQDASIATATYKLNYLLKHGENPTHIPGTYSRYDKELQTQGLGGWVNEYIGIPSGWGRIYKDEMGFIPSFLSMVGSALDNSYLYYTGGQDTLGLNTIYQPFTTSSAFYQDGSFAQQGLFSTVLGFGSSYAITTASAVALYLSVGEPLSLLMSEAVKENIQASINNVIPAESRPANWFMSVSNQAARQFTLGAGLTFYSSDDLRRSMIFASYERSKEGSVIRSNNEFFSPENFNISYYHLNSLMRRRGELLLENIAKPFLMEVINPYVIADESHFLKPLDELITEVGKSIGIRFDFASFDTPSELFEVRDIASRYHDEALSKINKDIKYYENALLNPSTDDATLESAKELHDLAKKKEVELGNSLNSTINYLLEPDQINEATNQSKPKVIPRGLVDVEVDGLSISKYRNSNKSHLIDLHNRVGRASVTVINAGEERQLEVAKKLQGVLNEIPLNPLNWRIFSKNNLKEYSPVKDYRVLGDILSFEEFTQTMRNLVLGQGGLTSFMAKYEIQSTLGGDASSSMRVASGVINRLYSFVNMAISTPGDALKALNKKRQLVNKLERSRSLYKGMEYSLAINDEIGWANSTQGKQFIEELNNKLSDPEYRKKVIDQFRTERYAAGDYVDFSSAEYGEYLTARARQDVMEGFDPYRRKVTNSSGTFLKAMSEIDSEISNIGDDALDIVSKINTQHRKEAQGILSLTSESVFNKRIAKLQTGIGKDPSSKITKSNIMTGAFALIALAAATESIFRSTNGVSLFTQISTAYGYGSEDANATVNFSNGPLLPISGTAPRLIYSLVTTAATGYAAYEIAGALRTIVSIDDVMYESTLIQTLQRHQNLSITHLESNTTLQASNLKGPDNPNGSDIGIFDGRQGTYRIMGQLDDGSDVNVSLIKDSLNGLKLKKSITFLEGRSVATAAIAFTVMSGAVMAAKSTAAWTLNEVRDQNKGLAPVIFPVAGAVGGYAMSKILGKNLGFAYGLTGFIAGSFISSVLPSSMLEGIMSLGRGENQVDANDWLVAGELSSFITEIKNRSERGKVSKGELMAGIYAQAYSDFLGVTNNRQDRRTHVVAKQSPLPFIQFFYAATTENQVRDDDGSISYQGTTRFTTGIQTAPLLGGSFSVGLPIQITPGSGLMGMTYSDKSNVLDLITGAQNLVVGLTGAAFVTRGFRMAVQSVLTKFKVEGYEHNKGALDSLLRITEATNDIGRTLFAEVPARIVDSMTKADYGFAKAAVTPTKNLYSYTLHKYDKYASIPINRNKNMLGKYFLGSFIGGLALGSAASTFSTDQESLESYTLAGNLAGYVGTPLIQALYVNREAFTNNFSPKITRPISKVSSNIAKTVGILPKLAAGNPLIASMMLAGTAAWAMTDSSFGISEGMDQHLGTRLATIGLYGAVVGSSYHHFGSTFFNTEDTFTRWRKIESKRQAISDPNAKGFKKLVNSVRDFHLSMIQRTVEADTNSVIKTVIRNQEALNKIAMRGPSINIDAANELSNKISEIETLSKQAAKESDITRYVLSNLSEDEFVSSVLAIAKAKKTVVGSFDAKQFAVRFGWRGSMPLVVTSLVFATFAGYLGNGSADEGMNKIYGEGGLLDWGRKQGSFLHGLSTVVSNTVKLITRTDQADVLPDGNYGAFMTDYVDRNGRPGLRRSFNLIKARNNPMSSVADLFSSAEKMFIMNSPNAFIQIAGPVGFTFRAGEYGKRVNTYVQIQAPGADISTASYSIAASYGFRAALDGSFDSGFNIQTAMRQFNEAKAAGNGDIDKKVMRLLTVQILSSTAKMEPLKKRRRFSQISNESLDFITVDPLLTASLNYRKQMMENMASQPLASLGTRMLLEASTNEVLGDTALLQALFNRDPDALKVSLDDRFGIISRNISIKNTSIFGQGKNNRNKPSTSVGSTEQSAWMEMDTPVYESSNSIPFIGGAFNLFNNTMTSLFGGLPGPFKWLLAAGATFTTLGATTYLIGSITLNSETAAFMNEMDEFYTSNLYQPTISKKGVEFFPIKSSYMKTVGGVVIRTDGRRTTELTKGNNLFSINQSFSDAPSFVTKLDKALQRFQLAMNENHTNFRDGMNFGEALHDRIINKGAFDNFRDLAKAKNVTPKQYLTDLLKEAYKAEAIDYINKFFNALAEAVIEVDGNQVSIFSLLVNNTGPREDLIEITRRMQGGDNAIHIMDDLKKSGIVLPHLVNGDYLNQQLKVVDEIVDEVVNELIKNNWTDDSFMLTKGRSFYSEGNVIKGNMEYVNNRILHSLSSKETSPLFTIKNYFGGLAAPTTVDRFRREIHRLQAMMLGDRGVKLAPEELDLTTAVKNFVTTTQVMDSQNNLLTQEQIRHVQRQFKNNPNAQTVRVVGGGVVHKSSSDVQMILREADNLNPEDLLPSAKYMERVKAKYKGFGTHVTGAAKALEIGTFAFDLIESFDVLGAYSRLGSSYTSGTYTEAQRMSLARETGGITARSLIAAGMGALMMNSGSLLGGAGTAIASTGIAGLAVTGAGTVAVGGATVSAALIGGIALAATAVVLGSIYLFGGKDFRKKVNSFIGGAYTKTASAIGSGLLSIGNISNQLGNPRAASTVLTGMGGLLGGLIVGIGLVSMGLFSGAVLAAIGASTAVGMGLGIIGGLLFPNQMARMSRSLSSIVGSIPFLGQFVSKEGEWLATTGEQIEGSPFFTGTAQQAIEAEFQRHIDIATSDSGTAMSQIITSREIYGGVTGDESYISTKSQGLIGRITPGSLVDPTLQRELRARAIMYSHTIVNRYMWNSMVASSSNRRSIKEAERRYKTERYREIENLEREARRNISGSRPRRDANGQLQVSQALLNNVVEINNMIVEDANRSSKALVIKVREDRIASSSMAVQVREYGIDKVSTDDLKNKISSANDKGVKVNAEVDEERAYIKEAVTRV